MSNPCPDSVVAKVEAPRWFCRPVDMVEQWKRGELAHHPFSAVVRMMNEEERARTRHSLEVCGYDRDWPIVIYRGAILDGRNRAVLARELWQETDRDELIPSFVELVPEEPERGDEAALVYVQQRLGAARLISEGERVVAAYKLYRLYCERLEARPQGLQGRSASARAAAEVVGVSPRSVERYSYVERHAVAALGEAEAAQLLAAVEQGQLSVRAAERRVRRGRGETARPKRRRTFKVQKHGVLMVRQPMKKALRRLPDDEIETVLIDGFTTSLRAAEVPELERVLSPTGEVWMLASLATMCELGHALASMKGYLLHEHFCLRNTPATVAIEPEQGWAADHNLLLWFRPRDEALARRDFGRAAEIVGTTTTWSRPEKPERLIEAILSLHRGPVLDLSRSAPMPWAEAIRVGRPVLCVRDPI